MHSGVSSNHLSKSIVVSHDQTAQTCPYGMREMQYRAYLKRNEQYLLVKAPPASGKSRALMYIALDKVHHQNLSKVIISVPQLAIGSSFKNTKLSDAGFFSDWKVLKKYNLCLAGAQAKTDTLFSFMYDPNAHYLVCAHATLTAFFNKVEDFSLFDNCLIAIDEFHHASAAECGNRLGLLVHRLITESTAHIMAMTGSYFRGDTAPILDPKDEELFSVVTYTYYEQLLACKYLKRLNIDYAFYTEKWTDVIQECLRLDRKTIVHIPSVNANDSTHDKFNERSALLDTIFSKTPQLDPKTHFLVGPSRLDGSTLKVADLIDPQSQKLTIESLRKVNKRDDVDIILALGMAKEGFDWPYCEHALTIGYRGSLTEVVQIIGRATRDCEGKETAYFTNLVKQPVADEDETQEECNTLLKAIALSMLMEQVLKPAIHFKTVSECQNPSVAHKDKQQYVSPQNGFVYEIDDSTEPISQNARNMLEDGCQQIIEKIFNSMPNPVSDSLIYRGEDNVATIQARVRGYLHEEYPDLSERDLDYLSQATTLQLCKSSLFTEIEKRRSTAYVEDVTPKNQKNMLANMTQQLINVNELDIDLVHLRSPFADAYQILSKDLDTKTFEFLQTMVRGMYSKMTMTEAQELWPLVVKFDQEKGREPSLTSTDEYEKRLAEVLAFIRKKLVEAHSYS